MQGADDIILGFVSVDYDQNNSNATICSCYCASTAHMLWVITTWLLFKDGLACGWSCLHIWRLIALRLILINTIVEYVMHLVTHMLCTTYSWFFCEFQFQSAENWNGFRCDLQLIHSLQSMLFITITFPQGTRTLNWLHIKACNEFLYVWPKFHAIRITSNIYRKVSLKVAHFAILGALSANFAERKVHLYTQRRSRRDNAEDGYCDFDRASFGSMQLDYLFSTCLFVFYIHMLKINSFKLPKHGQNFSHSEHLQHFAT